MIGENPDADRDDASEGRARRRAARGADKLVDVVHQRHRLRILVHLTSALEADFRTLKTTLELTDGNLGRHLDILAAHNLIIVSKGFAGRRPRTTVSITDDGRTALHREIEALRDLLDS